MRLPCPLGGGGDADGVAVKYLPPGPGVRVERCRAWDNSDDGFDLWESEAPVTIVGGSSLRNGWVPGTRTPAGDGTGYKLGRNDLGPRHVLDHVAARDNRAIGIDGNGAAGPVELRSVTAAGNGGWAQVELGPFDNVVIGQGPEP